VPTSGHRAYPYRWWPLEDLADISDINMSGLHDRPSAFDHTMPPDWPDHYQQEEKPPKRDREADLRALGITQEELEKLADAMQAWTPTLKTEESR
jgi:hypothetical protein